MSHAPRHRPRSAAPLVTVCATLASLALLGLWSAGVFRAETPTESRRAAEETSPTARTQEESDPQKAKSVPEALAFPRTLDVDGEIHRPGANPDTAATVFAFLATHCPISNAYLPELNRLRGRFASAGVEFYGVIADPYTTRSEAAAYRDEYGITFPVLLDASGSLQRLLEPTHTPHAIVVDQRGRIAYSGRIDDRYQELSRPRPQPQRRDLQRALRAVLDGRRPAVQRTEAVGCLLQPPDEQVASQDVTFCRDIAPIVFANCARCHREGEAAPFPLTGYEDVRRRAAQVAYVVGERIMPPWKPAPDFGHFQNEQRLTRQEIALIEAWAENGAPRGDPAHRPPLPEFPEGWQLGEPDLVLEMPAEFEISADGPDIYQHFVLPAGLAENRLVSAFEYRPGNAQVVHHAFLYLDTTGEARRLDAADPGPGYSNFGGPGFAATGSLGGWGPGGLPRRLPDDMGRPMPKNADLVLQVHYHPTGKPERDRSKVGLYFAPPTADRWVTEIMVADVDLVIPAGVRRHRFEASYTLPVATSLLDASPHMHLLGRAMKVTATTPAGRVVPLIRIDDWNFYWQDHYVYEEPVRLPAGTRIDMVAWYDNSADNPHNPHSPPRTVYFGEHSDDEMGICYFQVAAGTNRDLALLARDAGRYYRQMMARYERDKARRTSEAGDASSPSRR